MVKTPYVDKNGIRKGGWSEEEDKKLRTYVLLYGHWNWRELPRFAGLSRCGKSCRLRWMNYLKPGLKKGRFDHTEEEVVLKLHHQLGKKWSAIAAKLPGRTDNEVKNYWHTHLKKRTNDQNGEAAQEQTANLKEATIQNEDEHNGGSSISPQTTLISQKQDLLAPDSNTSCLQELLQSHHVPVGCSATESSMSNFRNLGVMNSSTYEDHENGLPDPFVQCHDSFWSDPFFTDTFSYSEASNSSIELSEVSTYGYSWYMEDVINSYDGNNFM